MDVTIEIPVGIADKEGDMLLPGAIDPKKFNNAMRKYVDHGGQAKPIVAIGAFMEWIDLNPKKIIMKTTLILTLLFIFLSAGAQTVVKKPITLFEFTGQKGLIKLDQSIVEKDTAYLFTFQNMQYPELGDVKGMKLSRVGLAGFVKTLTAAEKAGFGDDVMMPDYSVTKTRIFVTFGGTIYQIRYDGGYCNLYEKQEKKLIGAIEKELQ